MIKILSVACVICAWFAIHACLPCYASNDEQGRGEKFFNIDFQHIVDLDDAFNLFCLKKSYPEILKIEGNSAGDIIIELESGKRAYYKHLNNMEKTGSEIEDSDIRASMSPLYPLEPKRLENLVDYYSPGRKRSYGFLHALYGADKKSVMNTLKTIKFIGKNVRVSSKITGPLKIVNDELTIITQNKPELSKYLQSDGGFYWRKIAGEKNLSAHAFGIAIDLSSKISPYWRWSNLKYHPVQENYPGDIIKVFENQGFIWGGK